MNQPEQQRNALPAAASSGFADRPPSQTWESVPLVECPQHRVWVWFKPASAPQGLVIRIPDETRVGFPQIAGPLTMRKLAQSTGLEPDSIAVWYTNGMAFDGAYSAGSLLDQPVPAPVLGIDPAIVVCVNVQALAAEPATDTSATPAELFERIKQDWNSSQEVGKELVRLRKQLVEMQGRLKTLNRDLSSSERLHATSQDKKDWTETKRWLREAVSRMSMMIKDYDIGDTSSAGRQRWYAETYEKHVLPRIPFAGLERLQRDFATYRKMLITLQINMSSAHTQVGLTAERRANAVLKRIQAKVREATNRKSMLGVMLDS